VAASASASTFATGVAGWSSAGTGVYGKSQSASGLSVAGAVVGDTNAFVPGVAGLNSSSFGVGVYGVSVASSGLTARAGVYGDSSTVPGVLGSSTHDVGVFGSSTHGVGVSGVSEFDTGVLADGGRTNLRLVPLGFTGTPTTGAYGVGDVYVDATGAIFQCVATGDFATATHPVFMRIGFNPLSPVRLVGTGAGQGGGLNAYGGQTIAGNGTLTVTLAGTLDAPVSQPSPVPIQASAVTFVLLAIAANSTTPIAVTIFPADVASPPAAYSLYARQTAASSEVTTKLGVGGSNAGKVKIFNREPDPVDVYLDVTGFYS
jgi:hypothetical protein